MNFIDNIPTHLRGWFYFIAALVVLAGMVGLLIVDVIQGGDPGEWLTWVVGLFGLGGLSLAARNTSRTREDDTSPDA